MSVFLELYSVRHRRAIKMFLIAFAVNHLPQPEKQSQAMNIALLKELPGSQLWKR